MMQGTELKRDNEPQPLFQSGKAKKSGGESKFSGPPPNDTPFIDSEVKTGVSIIMY